MVCRETSRHCYTGLKKKKTDAKQHQLFNDIFKVNVSTTSKTFNLSISLKIIELKALSMSLSASRFKCITKYCSCIIKSSLYIVLVCPNLPLDTALSPGLNQINLII